jgi:hypothetical protein
MRLSLSRPASSSGLRLPVLPARRRKAAPDRQFLQKHSNIELLIEYRHISRIFVDITVVLPDNIRNL